MNKDSLLIKISDYYNIKSEIFEELGVLDSLVYFDTPLFLNPKLLSECSIPEFKNSKQKIIEHYQTTINLLKKTNCNDLYWKAAKKHFNFPEPSGIGLGTSMKSTDGNGLTGKTAEKCLLTLKEIVNQDIDDPTMYRLLFLVQENIGVDRISDMICRIIYDDLCLYSNNMIEKLCIKDYYINSKTGLKYLKRPNGKLLFLLPADLLSEIPDVLNGYDIQSISEYNQKIKEYLCEFFNTAYINITAINETKKEKMRECLLGNKELLEQLLYEGNIKEAEIYDYSHDPLGIVNNLEVIREKVLEQKNVFIELTKSSNSLQEFVNKLLLVYKRCIEDLGLNEELYYIDSKTKRRNVRKEVTSHRLFIIVLEVAKQLKLYDYSFEPKVGNGQIEFVIYNMKEKILIEFKLSKNNLIHGYDKQLPIYIKRYESTYSFYVIVKIDNGNSVERFYKEKKTNISNCSIIEIDGTIKKSPSSI